MSGYISAILKDQITNEDVTNIILNSEGFKPDYQIPNGVSFSFSASFNMPGNLKKIGDLKNSSVMISNLSLKSGVMGIIQLIPRKSETPDAFVISKSELDDLILKMKIKERVFSYDVYVNLVRDGKGVHQRKEKIPELLTIKKPRSFGLRIVNDEIPEDDIRTQLWKQINIEPIVQDPTKLSITMIFRDESLEDKIISEGFADIEKLLNYLKENNNV